MAGTRDIASKAIEEAAEWSVLLQDAPDDRALRRRFEDWHRQSAANAAAWEDIRRTSDLAAEVLPDYAHEWEAMKAGTAGRPARSIGRRRWVVAAASVALAAVIAWAAVPIVLLRLEADHLTGKAELRVVTLQDGSVVTLAPESAIAVTFTAAERNVRLLTGEGYFAVTPDKDRPFRVAARSLQASVLGTSFDVRLDEAGVMVAVQEGRVLVEDRGAAETLQAGQAVHVAAARPLVRTELEPGTVAMWRQGMVYLRNRPFAEAVDELRRYFPGAILVTDAALEKQSTTGVINLTDPEAALRGLAQAHGARVRRVSPWLIVVSGS